VLAGLVAARSVSLTLAEVPFGGGVVVTVDVVRDACSGASPTGMSETAGSVKTVSA